MAILKQRLLREGSSGTFDTIHLETQSGLVIMPDGSNLDQIVEALQTAIAAKAAASHTHSQYLTSHQSLSGYVPTSRTINGKALTGNVTLTASDVSAAAANHTHSDMGHPYTGIHMIAPSIANTDTSSVIDLGSWVTSCILAYYNESPPSGADGNDVMQLFPLNSVNTATFGMSATCSFSGGKVTFRKINGTNSTKISGNAVSYTTSGKTFHGTIHLIY